MTLRTKTNLAGILAAVLGNLVVFSHILRIPDSVQWGLMLGVLLLLGVQFHYFKKLKEERAREISRGAVTVTSLADQYRRSRRRLIIIWICLIPFTLSMPRWLPYVSGSHERRLNNERQAGDRFGHAREDEQLFHHPQRDSAPF